MDLCRERVVSWLVEYLDGKPSLRRAIVDWIMALSERDSSGARRRQRELARDIATLEKQSANLAAAIADGAELGTLIERLRSVEDALRRARAAQLAEQPAGKTADVEAKQQVEHSLCENLIRLASNSFEFAELMRRILPVFVIQPVQALDTPLVRPRAKMTFQPTNVLSIGASDSAEVADVQVVIDLFDAPLHIRHLSKCLEGRAEVPKLSLKKLAVLLEINYMTVKRSLDYARRMEAANTHQPYCELQTPPERASRWCQRRQNLRTPNTADSVRACVANSFVAE